MEYDIVEFKSGTVFYFKVGTDIIHREDGPAIVYADGERSRECFILNGTKRLLLDYANGSKYWGLNGKRHRTDRPAIEYKDGSKEWWVDGKRHRLDGPAIEWSNGVKEWYVDGKRHRLDGPAIEWINGGKSWYIEGEVLTEEEFIILTQNHVYKN